MEACRGCAGTVFLSGIDPEWEPRLREAGALDEEDEDGGTVTMKTFLAHDKVFGVVAASR